MLANSNNSVSFCDLGAKCSNSEGCSYVLTEQALAALDKTDVRVSRLAHFPVCYSSVDRSISVTHQILDFAREYPEGFTLDIRTRKLLDLDHGYVVAIEATQASHDAHNIPTVLRQAEKHNLHLVGGWWDEETQQYYYDACAWCSDFTEAVQLGLANHQLAIYDVANETVIRLEK